MCEEVIKEVTSSVFKYVLPDRWSDAEKEANPIAAENVVEAIKDGKDVEIKNAVITGPFILKSVNVEGEVTIQNTTIRGPINWSYVTFKRVLNLENSIFETDTTFTTVTVEKDIFLDGATFCGKAVFADIAVMGVFYSQSTTFKKEVIFTDGTFKKRIKFSKCVFEDEADFESARIGGNAEFTGAEFKKVVSFNQVQIEGAAFFNPATFVGEADFISARIGSTAVFNGATFKKQAIFNGAQIKGAAVFNGATFKKQADFNRAQIKDSAFFKPAYLFSWDSVPGDDDKKLKKFLRDDFDMGWAENSEILKSDDGKTISIFKDEKSAEIIIDDKKEKATLKITDGRIHELKVKKENGKLNIYNPATFVGEADFISARIGSNAEFTEATFNMQASFNSAQIGGAAFFNPATFVGEADFIGARIGSSADFTKAVFVELADFHSAQIENSAIFNEAKFKQQAYFDSAQIERESHFEGTIFANDVSFQDTTLKTVFWGEPNVQFKNIDLRGCIYKRFQPIPFWKQLMEHLGPYDRRPFTQLEETFRRAGKDKLADDVYYMRKCREFTENIAIRKYLFSWDCVPGDDDEKLKKFLKEDLDIGWTENAEIRKSEDGMTLSISKDEKRSEIIRDAIKKKATLKISDGRTFYLNVKKEQGKLNIYRTWSVWLHSALRKHGSWSVWLQTALRKHGSWSVWLHSALRNLGAWLLDRFLFVLTGYGVRLYRLLVAFVPILIIGTFIFHLEGAVVLRPDILPPPVVEPQDSYFEAFWVSLNTFLPIEIPSGVDWKPSSQIIPMLGIKFTTFATFLDLAGWILVPVGVAGITGLLKRSK